MPRIACKREHQDGISDDQLFRRALPDNTGTGDDVEPPYAGDGVEVAKNVLLAHRTGGDEEEGFLVEEPGAKM